MRSADSSGLAVETGPATGTRATTEIISEFLVATTYEQLPPDVVRISKRVILDLLGCAIGAAALPDIQTVHDGIGLYDHGRDAGIWGTRRRASQPMAAMANGTAAHARELDDCGGPGHVGTVVIPAALAVSEGTSSSGAATIRSVALGYEVLFRIADGVGGYSSLIDPGWHPISVVGAFGSAAAAGLLLTLSPEQFVSALGLAGSFAGGDYAFLADGSMSKRWHAGRVAANGIEAAYLAMAGFVGPTHVLTSDWGSFYRTHFPDATVDLDAVVRGLGVDYRMRSTVFKAYACCLGIHPFIEALNPMVAAGRLVPERVEAIDIECEPTTLRICGKKGDECRTVLDAQMSLPFTLGVLLTHRRVALADFDDCESDEGSRMMARKVRLHPASGSPGRLTVRFKDGTRASVGAEDPRGSLSKPLSDSDLEAKFLDLVAPVLGKETAARIVGYVWQLDELSDVGVLTRLLTARH
jgi:2-methylcitrate dehydratase PrpD